MIAMNTKKLFILLLNFCLPAMFCSEALAWPTTAQWVPVYKAGIYLQDPSKDAAGSRDIVSDATHPAAFMFNDGTYIHFRLRLDADPSGQGGQGLLQPYGWGVVIDTNNNPANYEWLLMLDGISQNEVIGLWQNTTQGTLGNPSDSAERLAASVPVSGNMQVSLADSALNGNADYFLDWRFPYATFKQQTGLTDSSPLRLFFGSSNNANSLAADLVGASDLYAGLSDVSTPLGTKPTTGSVKFVTDLAGNGDVIQINAGTTLFLRVDDGDVNYDNATKQTLTVILAATSGDTSTLTLTETGINTGIFTASIPTQAGAPVANDGILQVVPGATVGVEYIDGIDANYNRNAIRADSVWIISLEPAIKLTKSADPATVLPGTEVIYTISYRNAGVGAASNLIIADSIPLFTTYVADSLKIGNAASSYATATALTDAADADQGQFEGGVIFTINTVAADDGIAGSGNDEGKVYFKVRVN